MKKIWVLLISIIWVLSGGCSLKYPVVGSFNNYNEVFKGQVEANIMTGTGHIEAKGEVTGVKCIGFAKTTYIPPISFILPVCEGQRGISTLKCDDGRIIEANYNILKIKGSCGNRSCFLIFLNVFYFYSSIKSCTFLT